MLQSELDLGLEIAELRAAVVALALEGIGVDGLVGKQRGNAVGELDLAAGAAADRLELGIDSPA